MYGNPIKLVALFAILIASLLPAQTNATHVVGADLNYYWLGGNWYQLRLYFYRDCTGISAPSSITLQAYSQSCGLSQNYTLPQVAGSAVEVPPICNLGLSSCFGGSVFGIQEVVYKTTIQLPGNCADWRFSYSVCCRNNAVTNINNPGGSAQYFYAFLDNLNYPGNTSPTFYNKPAPYQCTNNPFCFDMSAFDPDGDSLAYTLVNPMRTATQPVTWLPGYSTQYPINSNPLMTMNNLSGAACIWPLTQGVYSMAVRVDEYRNGNLIGSIIRDIQQNLQWCPCVTPLPVDLLDFSSEYKSDHTVELMWTTGSEFNSDHFVLERSFDSENFEHVGVVSAAGNANSTSQYDFIDDDLKSTHGNIVYYRLTQFDLDGKSKVLKTIAQRIDRNIEPVELLNNPVRDEIRLLFTDAAAGQYEVTLLNTHGRVIKTMDFQKSKGLSIFTMPLNDPSSVLYVNIRTPDNQVRVLKAVQL